MKTKFPIYESILLLIILVLCLMSGCKVPQKTPELVTANDTIVVSKVDSFYIEQEPGYAEVETRYTDTIRTPCPPVTVINAHRVKNKAKDSYNYIGEINDLKRSVQIKDSQIDSLNIQLGRKCVGEQTNNGAKWYLWFFIGCGCGGLLTITGRLLIKKGLG